MSESLDEKINKIESELIALKMSSLCIDAKKEKYMGKEGFFNLFSEIWDNSDKDDYLLVNKLMVKKFDELGELNIKKDLIKKFNENESDGQKCVRHLARFTDELLKRVKDCDENNEDKDEKDLFVNLINNLLKKK